MAAGLRLTGPARSMLGRRTNWIARHKLGVAAGTVFVMICLAAVLAPVIAPYGPREIVSAPLRGTSVTHLLGTDGVGRDILTRLLYGTRVSLVVGLGVTALATLIGVPWGLLSGYAGGAFDAVSMRVTDGLLAFPDIVLALALVAVLGPNELNLIFAIGIVNIPRFSRLIRGETLIWSQREVVNAERVLGAGSGRILVRVILPNLLSVTAVQMALTFATAILSEAALSFIGLGVQPPKPSWGGMLSAARSYMTTNPLFSIYAGVAIFVTVMSMSLLGDLLRDVFDSD